MDAEGVAHRDFNVAELPEINAKGEVRAVVSPVMTPKVKAVSDDPADANKCQVELEFMLLRGSYATVLLREIMKPKDLIAAGF